MAHPAETSPEIQRAVDEAIRQTTHEQRPFELWGPVIGNDVNVGTGAKILGKVQVGDGVKIGANAVVVSDIPAHHTAVGVPARSFPTADKPADSSG